MDLTLGPRAPWTERPSSPREQRWRRIVTSMDQPPAHRAFHIAYEGTPSWETGRPQPAVLGLLDASEIRGRVLDVGCGTGLHAALVASRGHEVTGLDVVPRAIERARARARDAGVEVRLLVGDVLELESLGDALGAPFDTVLDVGLFHVLQPADRHAYARALAGVVRRGGAGFVLAWSDRNAFGRGPARVSRRELRHAFRSDEGWRVDTIEPVTLETRLPPGWVHAWLTRLQRR